MKITHIVKNLITIYPGGTYDMVKGNYVEHQVLKLSLLQLHLEKLVEKLCDCGEIQAVDYKSTELLKIAEELYDRKYKDSIENYSLYKVEFNQEDYNVPQFLLEEPWADVSWHNDECPSFVHVDKNIKVWVLDSNSPWSEGPQYSVIGGHQGSDTSEIDWDTDLYECDTEESLLKFLSETDWK
jgi:hypothetical protein